jgi:hypothetical protein
MCYMLLSIWHLYFNEHDGFAFYMFLSLDPIKQMTTEYLIKLVDYISFCMKTGCKRTNQMKARGLQRALCRAINDPSQAEFD